MLAETDTVTIYRPTVAVLADLNAVPGSVQLVAEGVACSIHRGVTKAYADASALGLFDGSASHAILRTTWYDSLGDRYVLVDQEGVTWLVRARPVKRDRFAAIAFVRCLITRLANKPKGIP